MRGTGVLSYTEFDMNHKGAEGEYGFKIPEISSITYTFFAFFAFVVKIPQRNISLYVLDRTLGAVWPCPSLNFPQQKASSSHNIYESVLKFLGSLM